MTTNNLARQHLLLLLNNPEKYIEKNNLMPIEYQIVGKEEVFGVLVPRAFTSTQIKKVIKSQVKLHGGRWLGKFRISDDPQKVIAMLKESIEKRVNKAKVMKELEEIEK